MLGPEGIDALGRELAGMSDTIEGLRLVVIALALTNVAVFAIVIALWRKVNPQEGDGPLIEVLPEEVRSDVIRTELIDNNGEYRGAWTRRTRTVDDHGATPGAWTGDTTESEQA